MNTHAVGTSHGKLILMGEHAVVYQSHAIALPFDTVQVTVQATHFEQATIYLTCDYYCGNLQSAPSHLANIQVALEQLSTVIHQPLSHLHLTIDSTIPQERGMGSSAAVIVALVRAVCRYYNTPLPLNQLHAIVNHAEKQAHGTTSGIDTLMTSTNCPIIYKKGQTPIAFDMNLKAYLVIADSGQTGQTKEAVQRVRDLITTQPTLAHYHLQHIDTLVQQAYQAIMSQNCEQLGALMSDNHHSLQQLGISTPLIDHLVHIAQQSNALGAKLTGGGLGGCVIALCSSDTHAVQLRHLWEQEGATTTWAMRL